MMKIIPILVVFLLLLSSCGGEGGGARYAKTETGIKVEEAVADSLGTDLSLDAMRWAEERMRQMTLEERVGQLFLPAIYAESDPISMRRLRDYCANYHIGGVVLLKGIPDAVREIAWQLRKSTDATPFIAMDAEWGLGMRLDETPVFPRNGAISTEADQGLMYDYGREVARECRLVGINMVLGPVADISTKGGVMGSRSFGSNPQKVAEMTVAYARGLEDGNVISVAKHFPGHGKTTEDSHRGVAVVSAAKEEIEQNELYPFRAYIEAGLSGVMAGHLAVPAMDSTMSPASFSRTLLSDLLRVELGFRGLVLTDALNMGGAGGRTAADALRAGADIILAPGNTDNEFNEVLHQVASGELPLSIINDRCRRVLFYKYLVTRELPSFTPSRKVLETSVTDSLKQLLRG